MKIRSNSIIFYGALTKKRGKAGPTAVKNPRIAQADGRSGGRRRGSGHKNAISLYFGLNLLDFTI